MEKGKWEKVKSNYFISLKFIVLMLLFSCLIIYNHFSVKQIAIQICFTAIMIMMMVMNESVKKNVLFIIIEAVAFIVLYTVFQGQYIFLLPVVILDIAVFMKGSVYFYLIPFTALLFPIEDKYMYMIVCIFIFILYYQNYNILDMYKHFIYDNEKEEARLKDSIHIKNIQYTRELEKSSLNFENKILEERDRISQALHDKLGHSINGSVYKLEACKLLIENHRKESADNIQEVIDELRNSMDEIRMILRKVKPDKKQTTLLNLYHLCEECRIKYGIQSELVMSGDPARVPDEIWDILLDNSLEAVTNAFKYSECNNLVIHIQVFNKVVRCSINDDGIGCSNMAEGMGISGMKQRVRRIKGVVDIRTDSGFSINMILPYNCEDNNLCS